jgi:hypothetical protein
MQHGQNQQWDNITLTLHNNLGNLLPKKASSTEILEARLSSKPASVGHTHPVPHCTGRPCIFSWPMMISNSVNEFFVAV